MCASSVPAIGARQVDYLNKPLEVFKEIRRVLRPGGKAIMSMSNRYQEYNLVPVAMHVFPSSSVHRCILRLKACSCPRMARLYDLLP